MINKFIGIIGFLIICVVWWYTTRSQEVNVLCEIEDKTIVCKEP